MKTLTVQNVKELKGKTIRIIAKGYAGQDTDKTITVGEVVTAYSLLSDKVKGGLGKLNTIESKGKLVLLNEKGEKTYCNASFGEFKAYNDYAEAKGVKPITECCFWMGDTDRYVQFEIVK